MIPSSLAAALLATVIGVHDGDTITIRLRGAIEVVRFPEIDAPELPPRARCQVEARAALKAARRLQALLPKGQRVRLDPLPRDRDRYGRLLASVTLPDGRNVALLLEAEGLARPWAGRRRSWCISPD